MTQEEYAQLIALGGDNAALEEQIRQQIAQAEQMRPSMPQTRMMGRVAVPPNALELIGGLAQSKTQGDLQKAALGARQQQVGNTNTQNQAILRAIMAQQQLPQQPAGNGFMPPAPKSPYQLGQ